MRRRMESSVGQALLEERYAEGIYLFPFSPTMGDETTEAYDKHLDRDRP